MPDNHPLLYLGLQADLSELPIEKAEAHENLGLQPQEHRAEGLEEDELDEQSDETPPTRVHTGPNRLDIDDELVDFQQEPSEEDPLIDPWEDEEIHYSPPTSPDHQNQRLHMMRPTHLM